jgi:ketosteroid isomerase-like protein
MSIEENKHLAHQFIDRFTASDIAGALDLMTDDATWWIAGKPNQLPAAGVYNKEQIARLLYNMAGQLLNGLKMTVKSLVAEDDKVAMEAESYGELRNGRVYNQEYHFLITIRDGRIAAIKEYLDTQHVHATWFQQ